MGVSPFPFSFLQSLWVETGNLWIWLILFEITSSEWTYLNEWLSLSHCIVITGILKGLPCTLLFCSFLCLEFLFDLKIQWKQGLENGLQLIFLSRPGKKHGRTPYSHIFWHSDHLLGVYLALSTTISVGTIQNFGSFSFLPRGGEWPEVPFQPRSVEWMAFKDIFLKIWLL